ncbi:tail fiber protein [Algoriphagus sp.]|uniref:phage tail protein n=1 Tax=Algoriphagus sp. TaxID=1872435 RepID=UPI0026238AE5|nr:tail fiber protein [Algoriphagus sp.]
MSGIDSFVGEIVMFPFNFAPRGFSWCDGQLLPISQNTALFSLLGTTYGGDGKSTFALPDLQGRVPMQQGQGPGLPLHDLGERGGLASVTLTVNEIPLHSHSATLKIPAGGPPDQDSPKSGYPATFAEGAQVNGNEPLLYADAGTGQMGSVDFEAETDSSGGGQAHNNMQPYLTCYYAIAMQGVFPPRT